MTMPGVSLGIVVLFGMLPGFSAAMWKIYGYKNARLLWNPEHPLRLGLLPIMVIQAGFFWGAFFIYDFENASSWLPAELSSIGVLAITAVGAFISLQSTMLRQASSTLRQYLFILVSHGLVGVVAGSLRPDISHPLQLGLFGLCAGVVEILYRTYGNVLRRPEKSYGFVFPFWCMTMIAGEYTIKDFVFAGIIFLLVSALLALFVDYMLLPLVHIAGRCIALLLSPALTLLWRKTILCNCCFHYTAPLRSRYQGGHRFCEHCQGRVDDSRDSGRVIFVFGNVHPPVNGRTFVCENPDCEATECPREISDIYIDTATCNAGLLEKCLTAILHDPPKKGRRAVKVYLQGMPNALDGNLRNVLCNNFQRITAYTPNSQALSPKKDITPLVAEISIKTSGTLERAQSSTPSVEKSNVPESRISLNPTPIQPSFLSKIPHLLHQIGGAFTGGILGAVAGSFASLLIASVVTKLIDTDTVIEMLSLVILLLFVSAGIRKGVQKHRKWSRAAIPLLVVGFVLGAIVIPNLLCAINKSMRARTAADIRAIGTALTSYQVDHHVFPTTPTLDIALNQTQQWNDKEFPYYYGPYRDAWNSPFAYSSDGLGYTVSSYGKDRHPGGKGEYNSDIVYINGLFVAPATITSR